MKLPNLLNTFVLLSTALRQARGFMAPVSQPYMSYTTSPMTPLSEKSLWRHHAAAQDLPEPINSTDSQPEKLYLSSKGVGELMARMSQQLADNFEAYQNGQTSPSPAQALHQETDQPPVTESEREELGWLKNAMDVQQKIRLLQQLRPDHDLNSPLTDDFPAHSILSQNQPYAPSLVPSDLLNAVRQRHLEGVKAFCQAHKNEFLEYYEDDCSDYADFDRDSHWGSTGRSALHLSLSLRDQKIFDYLFSQDLCWTCVDRSGAGENMLHTLIREGDLSWMSHLINRIGASDDYSTVRAFYELTQQETQECAKPMLFAAQHHRYDMLNMLIDQYQKYGVDVPLMQGNKLHTMAEEFLKIYPKLEEQAYEKQKKEANYQLDVHGYDERQIPQVEEVKNLERQKLAAEGLIEYLSRCYRVEGRQSPERPKPPEQKQEPHKRYYGFSKPPEQQNYFNRPRKNKK